MCKYNLLVNDRSFISKLNIESLRFTKESKKFLRREKLNRNMSTKAFIGLNRYLNNYEIFFYDMWSYIILDYLIDGSIHNITDLCILGLKVYDRMSFLEDSEKSLNKYKRPVYVEVGNIYFFFLLFPVLYILKIVDKVYFDTLVSCTSKFLVHVDIYSRFRVDYFEFFLMFYQHNNPDCILNYY